MTDIKVSVIIPIYNVEKYLRQTLESVASQTLKDIEIICVDDGSTDSSFEIVKEFAEKDNRFIPVAQKNGGAGAARNNGLRRAKGKYLSFLDSDDFFSENMLEEAYKKAEETKADFVVFQSDQYYEDTNEYKNVSWTLRYDEIPPYQPFSRRAMTDNIFKVFVGWAWDKLYNREWVLKNNLWFQEIRTSNDMVFVFSAVAVAKRIACVDKGKILVHQRRNNKSSLSNTREKSWDCFYKALIALRERLINEGIYKEVEKDYINYALHFSLWHLNTIAQPTYDKLYSKLKNEWWKELGIEGKDRDYFYNKKEYEKYLSLIKK
ncbi:MAG: glycosyltransferase [Clostridiales bacterium]|nr:glycosyltransferase [Clostridiales bacterium]